jgi:hypothetical protein
VSRRGDSGRITCTVKRCGNGARIRRIALLDPNGNRLDETTRLCEQHWIMLRTRLAAEDNVTVLGG